MLNHIRVHHGFVELQWALLRHVVVDLAFLGLDHVRAVGVDGVGQRVVLKADVAGLLLLKEVVLVLPAGLLLVHETARWALVFLLAIVEFAHHLIEGIHLQVCLGVANGGILTLVKQSIKLGLNTCNFVLQNLVVE